MTGIDALLVAIAALDLLLLAAMVVAVNRMRITAGVGQRRIRPALREARAVADAGTAFVVRAKADGQAVAVRVQTVAARVRRRYETTRHLVRELRPQAHEAAAAARDAGKDAGATAHAVGELARRLKRLHAAADAANQVRQNRTREGSASK